MPVPTTTQSYSTIAELKMFTGIQDVVVPVLGAATSTDLNGGNYRWDSTNTTTDDGFLTIQATGVTTGRWLRVGNSNTIKGTASFTGTGLVGVFNVVFTTAMPFTPAQVQVQALTASATNNWVTNKSSTGFTVNFLTIPALSATIGFDWLLIKQ